MQEIPRHAQIPNNTFVTTFQSWWNTNRTMLRVSVMCLLVLIGCGWYALVSKDEVRSQLQSWLVNDQVHAMQRSDIKLSDQARKLEGRIAQLESGLTDLHAQYADDRTQTVDLQDQLKDAAASMQGTASPKPSPSTKASAIATSPKPSLTATSAAASNASSPSASVSASTTSSKVNINSATVDQLDSLPGIGATYAQRIVEYRQQNGAFGSVDDLLKVKGIGTSMLAKIRDLVEL